MADLALNLCSVRGPWFRDFLANEAPYKDYFVTVPEGTEVSSVVCARTHPLLTPFETAAGTRWVWNIFSADQADLGHANPDVMLEMLDVFLGYIAHGARVIHNAVLSKHRSPSGAEIRIVHGFKSRDRDIPVNDEDCLPASQRISSGSLLRLLYVADSHSERDTLGKEKESRDTHMHPVSGKKRNASMNQYRQLSQDERYMITRLRRSHYPIDERQLLFLAGILIVADQVARHTGGG